jgi:WhiB family transcriptional regulator, redox-sensing transcriptional regulator
MAEVSWLSEYKSAAAGSAPSARPVDVLGLGAAEGVAFDAGLTAELPVGPDGDEQGWQESALCAETDPEAFFPEKGGSTREAKKICTGCEVRAECLEFALANDERFGIWGGLSERERRRLRRQAS